jgi:hypothetical protein
MVVLIHRCSHLVVHLFRANSIIGPKLIASDNVWKADQPAVGNGAFTFQRVKEKNGDDLNTISMLRPA